MYFKVALIVSSVVLFSACTNPFGPKPKNPNIDKKLGVEVVEEVGEADSKKVVKEHVKLLDESKVKKAKKPKPVLKPEPFSLESNEDDPELLGPQSTLGKPLTKDETLDSDSNNSAS